MFTIQLFMLQLIFILNIPTNVHNARAHVFRSIEEERVCVCVICIYVCKCEVPAPIVQQTNMHIEKPPQQTNNHLSELNCVN